MAIISVIFAIVFVGIFAIMWISSTNSLGMEIQEVNSLYTEQYPIDVSMWDGTTITGKSVASLKKEINNNARYSTSIVLNGADSINTTSKYSSSISENNGILYINIAPA